LIPATWTPRTPPAPDYHDEPSRAALPELEDGADVALEELPGADQSRASAALFYLHPTTWLGKAWNAPTERSVEARLIAAYLPGANAHGRDVGPPTCDEPTQTGCVTARNARGPAYVPTGFELDADNPDTMRGRICVNPITWRSDATLASVEQNPGAVFFDTPEPHLKREFADAQCSRTPRGVPLKQSSSAATRHLSASLSVVRDPTYVKAARTLAGSKYSKRRSILPSET
jgi:hypothetical protein